MAGRKFRTSKEMFPLIKQDMRSGLSQKTFCLQHGLSYGAFHYWHKKDLRERQSTDQGGFAEIQISVEQERSIIIRYTSGTELYIPLERMFGLTPSHRYYLY